MWGWEAVGWKWLQTQSHIQKVAIQLSACTPDVILEHLQGRQGNDAGKCSILNYLGLVYRSLHWHKSRALSVSVGWFERSQVYSYWSQPAQLCERKVLLIKHDFLLRQGNPPRWSRAWISVKLSILSVTVSFWTKCPAHNWINTWMSNWLTGQA